LRENFDRFNFELHKEKEMVSFRRFVLALAVLALFTGLASAQVLVGSGGSGTGSLVCTANVANPTQARAEGHTELLGDIVIACTGGSLLAPGSPVPTANITVTLANTYVTSRQLSNGLSEALLLIDEPGAPAGAGAGFGFNSCGASLQGAGPGGCSVFASSVAPPGGGPAVYTASTSTTGGAGTVVNVFNGIVPGGSNQVIFNGIPILPPVTAGFARVFRITNVRASAAQLSGGGTFQGTTSILAGVTISSGLLLQSPVLTAANVFTGLTTSVRNAADSGTGASTIGSPLLQCNSQGLSTNTAVGTLRFSEGFASAFKTRIAPTATLSGAATPVNSIVPSATFTQNTPGTVYGGSESGFILANTNGTAGLADFGTRLKATFNNIPTGVTIYVTTTNVTPGSGNQNIRTFNSGPTNASLSNLPVNASSTLIAGLVIGENAGAQGVGGGFTGFLPLAGATSNVNGTGLLVTALTPDANGTATAVWEILQSNPAASESADFGVFYSYTGNQVAGTPQITPQASVSMSFAPTVSAYNGSTAIPRFAPASTSTPIIAVQLCQTVLLFPFVNTTPGFDTGVAIANTTADVSPFATRNQTGACTLNFFGSGAGTTTSAPFPSAGGNIAPGTLNAEQVSNIRNGFSGYIIAVCNFQLAHGYALFSDTGIRNWATGYLALVLVPDSNGNRPAPESLGN
jgi:hypothetical protein